MSMQFRVAERGTNNHHLALLRWSMVAIFIWFGIQKFTPYAADSIAPLISHSVAARVGRRMPRASVPLSVMA